MPKYIGTISAVRKTRGTVLKPVYDFGRSSIFIHEASDENNAKELAMEVALEIYRVSDGWKSHKSAATLIQPEWMKE